MPAPGRFTSGITNVDKSHPLGMYGLPDPSKWHFYWSDWDFYTAADWVVTLVGAGTQALTAGDGGLLLLTNAAADDNSVFTQKGVGSFLMEAGKRAFFRARFKVSDATQSDFVMGLQIVDTTPLDATDGIYFMKDDGDAQLDVYCRKDATTGSTSATNIATVVTDTFLTVAWYYDGKSTLTYYVNDAALGSLSATSSFLPDATLTLSWGIQNGEAVAKTMTIDYVFAAKER